jgi:hypothetical protein
MSTTEIVGGVVAVLFIGGLVYQRYTSDDEYSMRDDPNPDNRKQFQDQRKLQALHDKGGTRTRVKKNKSKRKK